MLKAKITEMRSRVTRRARDGHLMERIPLLGVQDMSINASFEDTRGLIKAMEPTTGEEGELTVSKDLTAASYNSMETDSMRHRAPSPGSADDFYHIQDQVGTLSD